MNKDNQILMFGGKQPTPVPIYFPKQLAKQCPRSNKRRTDFIGSVCVECHTELNLNGGKK